MDLDDPRWTGLEGGYRIPFDPRPLLGRLSEPGDRAAIWSELWTGLYHQGDVGSASYASVPHLVESECARSQPDWNAYALVASIDLARDGYGKNDPPPDWLKAEYEAAIGRLGRHATTVLPASADPLVVRSALAVVALWKGHRHAARLLAEFDDQELAELELPGGSRIFPEE